MEEFISGYCRSLDESRMVTLEDEDGEVRIDCRYEACPHRHACEIAKRITCLLGGTLE